jgi:hypothetical protein
MTEPQSFMIGTAMWCHRWSIGSGRLLRQGNRTLASMRMGRVVGANNRTWTFDQLGLELVDDTTNSVTVWTDPVSTRRSSGRCDFHTPSGDYSLDYSGRGGVLQKGEADLVTIRKRRWMPRWLLVSSDELVPLDVVVFTMVMIERMNVAGRQWRHFDRRSIGSHRRESTAGIQLFGFLAVIVILILGAAWLVVAAMSGHF